jgi:ABC-type microcin C transport system permease subunit YejB
MNVRLKTSHLSKADRRKLHEEVKKEWLQMRFENSKRIDASLMLMLHRVFGFGKVRLERFHKEFIKEYNRLCDYYEDDGAEIAIIKLKDETGIDIDKLYEEEGIENA